MSSFNLKRFSKFMRFELLTQRSELLLPLLVPLAIFVFWSLLSFLLGHTVDSWPTKSFIVSLLLGTWMASNAHRRELAPTMAPLHVLLPVSHMERFWVRWCISFGLSFFGQILLLTVATYVLAAVGALLGRGATVNLLPDSEEMLAYLGVFATFHSLFFAGGIFFRRHALFKTILYSLLYCGTVSLITVILVFLEIAPRNAFESSDFSITGDPASFFDSTFSIGKVSWQVIFPLLLYIAAYYRAQENEVRG